MKLRHSFDAINQRRGMRVLADFGCVYDGPLQAQQCAVALRIERWPQGTMLRIDVTRHRGRRFGLHRFLVWPYEPASLARPGGLLDDLAQLAAAQPAPASEDPRSRVGRWVDQVIGREVLGYFIPRSLVALRPPVPIRAEFVRVADERVVIITQRRAPYGQTVLSLPPPAFAAIREALRPFATHAGHAA